MKPKNNIAPTYIDYIQNAGLINGAVDERELAGVLDDFQKFARFTYNFMPVLFVFDFAKRKYLFFTDNVKQAMGYEAKEVIDGGPGFMDEIYHKDFFRSYNEDVFPFTLNFLRGTPQIEHIRHTFSYNMQMKTKAGQWIDLLQKNIYVSCKNNGVPLFCLGAMMDISCLKKNNVITHSIEKADKLTGYNTVIETRHFYPCEEDRLLTRQEKNILRYMAEGLSSKMLADKLQISENTISNHRQNIIRKTNTKNVAQLIAFAIRNSII
jgi:DNA-binding CsgD family transcriptional regulator